MLKQGIKNYFINLKHFFTPLGTLLLGIIIGLSIAIPGIINSTKEIIEKINLISSEITLDFNQFQTSLFQILRSLNWNEPLETIQIVFSKEWLNETFMECLKALMGVDYDTYAKQIADFINIGIEQIGNFMLIFFAWIIIGIFGGFILTKFLVQKTMIKRNLWRSLLNIFIDSLLTTTFILLGGWLFSIWQPSVWLVSLLSLLAFGAIGLVEAYLLYGIKKIKFTDVVNFKNIGSLYLTHLVIYIIAVLLVLFVELIANAMIAIVLGISLIEISYLVSSMNFESYVKNVLIEKNK